MVLTPCKNCTERQIGCHSVCPRYAEYKEAHEAAKQELREIKALDEALDSYERRKSARLFKK